MLLLTASPRRVGCKSHHDCIHRQGGYILSAYAMFGFTKIGGINIPPYALRAGMTAIGSDLGICL